MFYIYPEKNLRAYPGALHGTNRWDETYKIRSVVSNPSIISRKTYELQTVEHKMQRHFMLTFFLQELLSY
jgi:hypothetical protein